MGEESGPFLRFDGVSKSYGESPALAAISLDIARGSFVALVGASGSGKSTLLKTVNRLVEPSSGRVLIEGVDVAAQNLARLRRRIGYVFQQVGLFPHMDVRANIGIGPRLAGDPLSQARIEELLALVELPAGFAARMPSQLSGGQRQRIGLARALAIEPDLLLLDEPLGALDPVTRDALGTKVRALHAEFGLTILMVTHDMAEALLLAERILVMDRGRIVADEVPGALLAGRGGDVAQGLVAVPRAQAEKLAEMER